LSRRREFAQEWGQAEERAHRRNTAITILDSGGVDDGGPRKSLRIDQDMVLLAVLPSQQLAWRASFYEPK
jgi:hypothetical protein